MMRSLGYSLPTCHPEESELERFGHVLEYPVKVELVAEAALVAVGQHMKSVGLWVQSSLAP